jgi:phosphate-selective porin OprO and OprP
MNRLSMDSLRARRAPLSLLLLGGLLAAGTQPAQAQSNEELAERIRQLEERLENSNKGNVSAQQRGGRIQFNSDDGNFTARVGGRMLLDTAWYDEDISPMGGGTKFRQARLEASGTLYKHWSYVFQYDLTGSAEDGIKDAYLRYNNLDVAGTPVLVSLGNQFLPFGFLGQQSPKYTMFMEQPNPSLMLGAGERRLSLRADVLGDGWRWSTAVARAPLGSRATDNNLDDPVDIATQVTYSPIREKGHVLMLGASFREQSSKGSDSHRLRTRPQTHLSSFRPVDTGAFVADGFTAVGAQAMYQRGRFELETEYFQQDYDAIQGGAADGEKPEFTGGFVNVGVFLTGESRAYDPRLNVFGPPTPARPLSQGGAGAWQLVANYSTLELSDQSITGGQIDMASLGVNWFPEQRLRFTLEYGSVLKVDGGPNDGDEPSFVQARAQVEW